MAEESDVIEIPARWQLAEPQVHLVRTSTSQGSWEAREDDICNGWYVALY